MTLKEYLELATKQIDTSDTGALRVTTYTFSILLDESPTNAGYGNNKVVITLDRMD